jgi:hypothetical protein
MNDVRIISFDSWGPFASPVWQNDSQPGRRLIDYLEPKIHSTLKERNWKNIMVVGHYKRDSKNIATTSENRGRLYNWQRPTAEIVDEDTVKLNCFPTRNYVIHYANLVSTYLFKMHLKKDSVLQVVMPKQDAVLDLFKHTNLSNILHADIVIFGYLDTCPATWISSKEAKFSSFVFEEGQLFGWFKEKTSNGLIVAYIGCRAALWGDSIAYLVQALRMWCDFKCVLYIGRVGSLDPELKPNQTLATGGLYSVDGTRICHNNVLSKWTSKSKLVKSGSLITVASPLGEDQAWYQQWKDEFRWVDCETAYIAQAAEQANFDFGYLHIVSDNLGSQYAENLANEDDLTVQDARARLFNEIDIILELFVNDYDHV